MILWLNHVVSVVIKNTLAVRSRVGGSQEVMPRRGVEKAPVRTGDISYRYW